jgi:hypothetical protein
MVLKLPFPAVVAATLHSSPQFMLIAIVESKIILT